MESIETPDLPPESEIIQDLGFKDVSLTYLLGFLAQVDDRPLYIESVLIAFHLHNGKWRMTHASRHPKSHRKHLRVWEIEHVCDAPCVGTRNFKDLPTQSEIISFMRGAWWRGRCEDGYELVRQENFPDTWQLVFGHPPVTPNDSTS